MEESYQAINTSRFFVGGGGGGVKRLFRKRLRWRQPVRVNKPTLLHLREEVPDPKEPANAVSLLWPPVDGHIQILLAEMLL